MKIRTLFLAAAAVALFATPALAGSKAGLAVGGNTIAGPGTVKSLPNDVDTLASNVDEDVCVTIANAGKGIASIQLDMTDDNPTVDSIIVAAGTTSALCQKNNVTVQVTCLADRSCAYSWRMDKK